jgi:cyanophycinase
MALQSRRMDGIDGVIALAGGGPFTANDDLDRRLLEAAGAHRVVVLPTADAYEQPALLVEASLRWAARLGVEADPLMVLQRRDAQDEATADAIRAARAVWLVGDSSMHLRSALKQTAVLRAMADVLAAGGVVAAVGNSAAALCDPMLDQRGGAFTLGLGLVQGVTVIPGVEEWSDDRRDRTLTLANTPVVELPTGSALLRRGAAWELVGDPVVHGELP